MQQKEIKLKDQKIEELEIKLQMKDDKIYLLEQNKAENINACQQRDEKIEHLELQMVLLMSESESKTNPSSQMTNVQKLLQ